MLMLKRSLFDLTGESNYLRSRFLSFYLLRVLNLPYEKVRVKIGAQCFCTQVRKVQSSGTKRFVTSTAEAQNDLAQIICEQMSVVLCSVLGLYESK